MVVIDQNIVANFSHLQGLNFMAKSHMLLADVATITIGTQDNVLERLMLIFG